MASVDQAATDALPAVDAVVALKAATPPEPDSRVLSEAPAAPKAAGSLRLQAVQILRQVRAAVWPKLPACLTSALVHAVLLAAMGLWTISSHEFAPPPELLVEVDQLSPVIVPTLIEQEQDGDAGIAQDPHHHGSSGGLVVRLPPRERPALDAAGVNLRLAAQPALARTTTMALPDLDLNLPATLPPTKSLPQERKPAPPKPLNPVPGLQPGLGMFGGRHPATKTVLVKKLGGNDESEAAVKRALAWIKLHQEADGHWSLHAFPAHPKCGNKCTHPGVYSDTAGTAMALLPFLAAGYTHIDGEHAECIGKGIAWLLARQLDDGGWPDSKMTRIYAHGQATILLAEAYAMTRDPRLQRPLDRALGMIANWQDEEGGWRYEPNTPGDVSVSGWQIMAIHSAIGAGIAVPPHMSPLAMGFLESHQIDGERGLFCYAMNKSPFTEAMTAEGLLSREYGGWKYEEPPLQYGVAYLLKNALPNREKPNMYYWYYATQVMHHIGGEQWKLWNSKMRDLLIELQIKEGPMSGSWTPKEQHDMAGGRLYMTSLACLTLEVYYRHMPLYYDGMNPEKQRLAAAR